MKSLKIKLSMLFALSAFVVAAQTPIITSFFPESGPAGSTVIITGDNYAANPVDNIVFFGAVQAAVTAASSTQLEVVVPVGSTHAPITVSVNGLTAFSGKPFSQTFSGSSGNFEYSFAESGGVQVKWSTVTDIDGDGRIDLIVVDEAANQLNVRRNEGLEIYASFPSTVGFPTAPGPYAVAAEDLNGDGRKDVVVTSTDGTVSVFENNSFPGNIVFHPMVSFPSTPGPVFIAINDLNKDGKPDIAVACTNNFATGAVSILENTSIGGAISFAPHFALPVGEGGVWCVRISDVDVDGKEDILVTSGGSNWLSVFRNINAGGPLEASSFAARVDYPTDAYPAIISISDFDGDGKPDAAVGNASAGSISVFRNASTPGTLDATSFTLGATISNPNAWNPAAGDLNGDGKQEILVRSSYGTVEIYKNESSPGWFAFNWTSTLYSGGSPLGIDVADIDGDELGDVIVSDEVGNWIRIYRNAPITPPDVGYGPELIGSTGFEANWFAVENANSYRIDVSTAEDFSVPMPGYTDKEVSPGSWSQHVAVTGLTPNTKYYYRVRVVINGNTSGNSQTMEVQTLPYPAMAAPNIWAATFGQSDDEEVQSMVSDNAGNIYIGGYFTGTLKLGSTTLTCQDLRDVFIAKLDANKKVLWAKSLGGLGYNNEVSLAFDNNSLYVYAQFSGNIDIDPGPGTRIFSNLGTPYQNDGFFAKYKANNGQLEWGRQLPDAVGWSSTSIAVNNSAIYVTGYFAGSVDFNPGAEVSMLNSFGGNDVFLAKFTLQGNFVWAKQMGGAGNDNSSGIVVDGSEVYIHGSIGYLEDVPPEGGSGVYEAGGFFAAYEAKSGNRKYVRNFGSGTVLTAAKYKGKLYLAGDFFLVTVVGQYPNENQQYLGTYSFDNTHGFVAQVDASTGDLEWASDIISTSYIGPRKILVDGSGIFINGYFTANAQFRPVLGHQEVRSTTDIDAFAANYDLTGNLRWAKSLGSPGRAVSIAATLTKSGYYLAGLYGATVNFDPYTGNVYRTSHGGTTDIFVAKYKRDGSRVHCETLEGEEVQMISELTSTDDTARGLVIFPNPAGETITIKVPEFTSGQIELTVKDMLGKTAVAPWTGGQEQTVRVGHLTSGVYFVKARQGEKIVTRRFIKK